MRHQVVTNITNHLTVYTPVKTIQANLREFLLA